MNDLFDALYQHFRANWKTSVQPILSVILVAAPMATLPDSPIHSPTTLWFIAVLTAVAKVYIGVIQQDAGTVIAKTSQGIKPVESHENTK